MKRFAIFLLMFLSAASFGQPDEEKMRQEVLHKNITDSTFIFGKWNERGDTETRLRYLGTLNTKEGKVKVMTSVWLWGLSCRATSRILLYDTTNTYLGNYYVGMTYDLPSDIENNLLIFTYADTEECNTISKLISLKTYQNSSF